MPALPALCSDITESGCHRFFVTSQQLQQVNNFNKSTTDRGSGR